MKQQLLTRHDEVGDGPYDSIAWALETHCQEADRGTFNAAILYGNEDCPSSIDFYTQEEPTVTDLVAYRWVNPLHAKQAELDHITRLIDDEKVALARHGLGSEDRQAIRAKIKRLDARYAQIRSAE